METRIQWHSTLQNFSTKASSRSVSVRTGTFGDSETVCVLWSDIQASFAHLSHLEQGGKIIFFEVDDNYRVCLPLRVLYSEEEYKVVLKETRIPADEIFDAEYRRLWSILEKSKFLDRRTFLIILASVNHERETLSGQIKRLEQSQSITSKNDAVMWQSKMQRFDFSVHEYDTINDLHRWKDHDPATHSFRLYFLCEYERWWDYQAVITNKPSQAAPQHAHICEHAGYDLRRADEFFRQYGQVALAILELIKFGYSTKDLYVPDLASYSVLDCCDGVQAKHTLTKANIESLVNKSYKYLLLKGTSHSGTLTHCSLSAPDTRSIRSFLRNPSDTDNRTAGLYRINDQLSSVRGLSDTQIHMQLGVLDIRLTSADQSRKLSTALKSIQFLYELSIHLHWKATLEQIDQVLTDIAASSLKMLQIAGIENVQDKAPTPGTFFNCVDDGNVDLVTVVDYRTPATNSVFLSPTQHHRYLLLCARQHNGPVTDAAEGLYEATRPKIDWADFNDALCKFASGLAYLKADARPRKFFSTLLDSLSTRLASHIALDLQELQVYFAIDYHWQGTFGVKDGIVQGVVSAKILTILPLESLVHGSLLWLDVPEPIPDYLTAVQYIMDYSPHLRGLNLPAFDHSTLADILHVQQRHLTVPGGLIVTLRQRVHSLRSVKNLLAESALEQLHIRCVTIDPTLKQRAIQLLSAVPWSTIKTLVLCGDNIDRWIWLWAVDGNLLSVDDEPFSGSQLMRLIIHGTGITGRPISHESALAIHGLVYISPLLELKLENITFQDERDWRLVIGAVELPSLDPFYRPRSYVQHIKVSIPEQLISTTVEDDVMFSASKNVQQRRVNRSRPIATI
ncbi:hypothetical protein BGZ74_005259 [Mortierella antarctica]|nr:hypothetical protein BGZ74_005259 [Mortierella antarctica]